MHQTELVKNCIRNNRNAQETLYRQYAPTMLGVCYRYTKSLDDAEDILQEGFIKVFSHLDKYKGDGELGAWINRIMINTALSYLRRHNRYRSQMQFNETILHPLTNETANAKLDTEALIELIRKLPTGYQTVFNLVAMEGYNHIEVAKMLSINENTCRSHYSRARAQLVKWINAEQPAAAKPIAGNKF
ncbi:RNA polymerase sigma factor [Parasegetibacter sp. NRK P23]|uniref:RNA polymerase sigma factor n=1 Tax=Parasegetibacter sp. NRK P23 TaxID=2942999 RepID=UPI0020437EEC|nr:RNA polymerase sigma factor [Parasegetibacter sp. NRK P23]MCM5527323.1 RNA polymerase sigma factor [Parasegetibacter sp. NRK P23]